MTWNDVLVKAILVIVTAVGPLITALVAVAINKLNSKIKDDKLKNYVSMVGDIVDAVVGHAQQTIVDDIKEKSADGKLTADEAKQIKQDVINKVLTILPQSIYDFLKSAEVDVTNLIDSFLESSVNSIKSS